MPVMGFTMEGFTRWTTLTLTTLILTYLVKVLAVAFDRDASKIPGPFVSRFTNIPLKIYVLSGSRTPYIHALHQKYGPYVRIAPQEIAIADVDAANEIHKVGTRFIKSPWYHNQTATQTDDDNGGVFCIRDAGKARARRRLFQQSGTRATVIKWEPTIVSLVNQVVEKIKRDATKGEADLVKWWTMMTADVLTTLAFGESFRMVEEEKKPQLIHDIEIWMIYVGIRLELPLVLHLIKFIPLPAVRSFMTIADRLRAAGYRAVENTKAAPWGSAKTLFSNMVHDDGSEKQPFSDTLMADEACNLIVAGTDTTAMALTYIVYEVLRNPDVKEKLLKELASLSDSPGWAELEEKEYLNNVIEETLRLHAPVGATLPRTVPDEGAFFGGYKLPGGYTVGTQAYTLHRDPKIWSEPESFDPDRWLCPTTDMKRSWMTFGGSGRLCLGQSLARLELLHAVSRFFGECPTARIADSMKNKSVEHLDFFVIKPVSGVVEITLKENDE